MTVRKRWIALLVAATLGAGFTTGNAGADVAATVIGGFESAAAANSVTVNTPALDHAQWSSAVVTQGSHSLEYDVGGASGGPTPQLTLKAGAAFDDVSWAGHEIISWDVTSNSPVQLLGQATVKDTAGHSWGHAYYIPAFGYHAFDAYVSDVAKAGVDVNHIAEIDMSLPRQSWPIQLYVDTMRLVDSWPYDHSEFESAAAPGLIALMRLTPRITQEQGVLASTAGRIPATDTAADRALRAQATSLAATLAAMQQQAAATGLDLTTAQGLNQQLQTVTGQVQRLDNVIAARRARPGDTQFGVLSADSMSLVFPKDRPCDCATTPATLALARDESQSEQVVIAPYASALSGAEVQVASISAPGGQRAALTATVDPVGFLNTTPTDSYHNTIDTAGWYTGWTPDPIRDDIRTVDIAAGTFQPYWVTLHAAANAPSGHYRITLRVTAKNAAPRKVVLTAEVWPFTLPDRPDLTTSFEFEPTIISQLYGITDPAQQTAKLRQYEDFLESYKMEPGNIYASTPPTVDDLQYIKNKWGLRHFNVLYLNGTLINVSDPSSWPAQIDSWVAAITKAMAEYKAAGLDKYAYVYGFDEATAQYLPVIKKTLTAIMAKFPDLPVMSTLRDNTMGPGSGLTGLVNIWAPQMDLYQQASADAAHARGDQAYWYPDIATGHPYPNWFNGYPPIDTRLMMGPMSHQSGVDGVLYYKTDRWVNHPLLTDGIYSNWNPATFGTTAGDGSLFYPGKDGPLPSIRLANFRDGMQDYNLLDLLANRITHAPPGTPGLDHARELLQSGAVVQNDRSYTESPANYRQWRSAVAAEIVRLRR